MDGEAWFRVEAPVVRRRDPRADQRAMASLYRANIDRLRAYLRRILRSEAEAEDVAQEAFIRLSRLDFSHFRSPRAVLFRTGYRLALNRIRAQRANPLDRAEPIGDLDRLGSVGDAEQALIDSEQEAAFAKALESLSPRCRQVIELRTVEQLSYKEMSDTLGISVSTLEKHLVRGKRVCAELMAAGVGASVAAA